jgi:DNA-directed RNA polymerase specialized sigma24 family protein
VTNVASDTNRTADWHLLEGMASGDVKALTALRERHDRSIYAIVFGILMDPVEADEVVAETFSYAWASAARFAETANRSVSGWLKEVARSRAFGQFCARGWPERSGRERLTTSHISLKEVA